MNEKGVAVLGASGHAKVLISTLRSQGARVRGLYDDDPRRIGSCVLSHKVLGPLAALSELTAKAMIAIGDNRVRERISGRFPRLQWQTAVHRMAYVDPTATLGEGTLVCAGAVIQPHARIGAHCIINTGATIDHDCELSDFVHLAPGVHLAGDVSVGRGAFIGIGALVTPGLRVGQYATVGAGAAVIRNVPDRAVVAGVPARPLQKR